MIIVPTLQCRPGMKLGRTVYTEQGHVLAARGFTLTEHAIQKLHQMGLPFLHIEEEGTEDISPDQAIRDETLIVLHDALAQVMEELLNSEREVLSSSVVRYCYDAAWSLIGDLKDRRHSLCLPVHLSTTLADGDRQHFMEHALNVGVVATKLGVAEGLSTEDLTALAMGAMLHDIGRLRLPDGLRSKAAHENFASYISHTEIGFKMLRDSGFPLLTAHCALFHHERIDGSGYPFGMAGERIHQMIQWVSIIDVYDTMVNGRGNGRPMLPHEALEVLYGGAGTLYDIDKVRRLRDNMALFPRGTTVKLNTGEIGVVSALHEDSKQRPIVRIIRNARGEQLDKPYEVDLRTQLHLMISGLGSDKHHNIEAPNRAAPAPQAGQDQPDYPTPMRDNRVFHLV